MAIILPANTLAASGFSVDNSCRFNGDAYLHKTVGTPTNADKYTLSVWIKRSILTSFGPDNAQYIMSYDGGGNPREHIRFNDSTDTLNWYFRDSGGTATNLTTNQEFRDVSAWYHFVFVYDSGQAVAANRQTIYCNGAEITSFSSSGYVAQDTDSNLNSNVSVKIGAIGTGSPSVYSSQYLSEVVFLDGQTLAASNFGEYDEDSPTIWKPKDVSTLTFGDNGFYLDFEDSANLGNDANGGTDWTEVGLAATDQTTDSPTNNFATWNPSWRWRLDNDTQYSEGNTYAYFSTASDRGFAFSSMAVSAGKWYWEVKLPTVGRMYCGVGDANVVAGFNNGPWDETGSAGASYSLTIRASNGKIQTEGSTETTYANAASDGDIIMFALDMDNHRLWYGINGTWQDSGDPTSGATGTGDVTTQIGTQVHLTQSDFISPCVGDPSTAGGSTSEVNFGNPAFAITSGNTDGTYGNFEYAVPSGFKALCTKNLAEYG